MVFLKQISISPVTVAHLESAPHTQSCYQTVTEKAFYKFQETEETKEMEEIEEIQDILDTLSK